LTISVIESKRKLTTRVANLLADRGVVVQRDPSISVLLDRVEDETIDVVLITGESLGNQDVCGLDLLAVLHTRSPDTLVVFMLETRLHSFHAECAPLTEDDAQLVNVLEGVLGRLAREHRSHRVRRRRGTTFGEMVGASAPMKAVYNQVRRAAGVEIPVLMEGETGTGKELVARAIHSQSTRAKEAFLPVNLGAQTSELAGSALFGHERGAFTGAVRRRKGVFEQALNGTVFLDEIDTADEKLQVSLLRVLEDHTFTRVGGTQPIPTSARVIAATNCDLHEEVKAGRFREDLLYRLDVFRITLPPLRERGGDIGLLAEHFIVQFSKRFKKKVTRIDPACMAAFEAYNWPGNVRELRNVIQRAVVMSDNSVLDCRDLPERLQPDAMVRPQVTLTIGTPLDRIEREVIRRADMAAHGNRTRAAKLLGISRRALYNKLRKHDLL
jgi:DNA-binding NtrC family response regulator